MSESDISYSLVNLSKVDPEKALPTDIFLKIDHKFIRFRQKGDVIGADKFDSFTQRGLEGIYVLDDDILTFLVWIDFIQENEVNIGRAHV